MANETTAPPAAAPHGPPPDKEEQVAHHIERLARTPRSTRDLLQGPEFKTALAQILPRAMTPERFVRVTLTALMRTPDLLNCTRESLFYALLQLSRFGLEPDGRLAHVIPFKNNKTDRLEAQLIIDYKGFVQLARQTGDIRAIHADAVYPGDEWSYEYGTNQHLKHKPALADRGDHPIAFYSWVKLRDGTDDFMVLSVAEVERVKKRSRGADAGPWKTDFDEMGKKTAFRRHTKWLPLGREVRAAVEKDDEAIDLSGWEELTEEIAQPEPAREKRIDRIKRARQRQLEAAQAMAADTAAEEAPKEAT